MALNLVRFTKNLGYKQKFEEIAIIASHEPKVMVLVPVYEPLQISKCENCDRIIAEPKELIRIMKKLKE